jgi:hypothetical protein
MDSNMVIFLSTLLNSSKICQLCFLFRHKAVVVPLFHNLLFNLMDSSMVIFLNTLHNSSKIYLLFLLLLLQERSAMATFLSLLYNAFCLLFFTKIADFLI